MTGYTHAHETTANEQRPAHKPHVTPEPWLTRAELAAETRAYTYGTPKRLGPTHYQQTLYAILSRNG